MLKESHRLCIGTSGETLKFGKNRHGMIGESFGSPFLFALFWHQSKSQYNVNESQYNEFKKANNSAKMLHVGLRLLAKSNERCQHNRVI